MLHQGKKTTHVLNDIRVDKLCQSSCYSSILTLFFIFTLDINILLQNIGYRSNCSVVFDIGPEKRMSVDPLLIYRMSNRYYFVLGFITEMAKDVCNLKCKFK